MRTLPARDHRGRFVAFPTTQAPSWYVLCVAGDRIAAEPPTVAPAPADPGPRVPPRALPRAIVRTRRPALARGELHSLLLLLLVIVVSAWYGLHLPVPHR